MSDIDYLLTAQIGVAWAGEAGEDPRLGWWRTDLVSEYGGEDLFMRLTPHTWRWALLQGVREAAWRKDRDLRGRDHNPERLLSLFHFGAETDERVEERLHQLKGSGQAPVEALPGLREALGEGWDRERFAEWVLGHGRAAFEPAPAGRRLEGEPSRSVRRRVDALVAALAPFAQDYPLPHYRLSV
jgi:hypothetical protein